MFSSSTESPISRRDFLKYAALGLGGLVILPKAGNPGLSRILDASNFPGAENLGRICVGKVDIRSRPAVDAPSVGVLYQDGVVEWQREVVGPAPMGRVNRRWVETPDGFIYAPSVQPVKNKPNAPLTELPATSLGKGMWAEVTVPYVDIFLDNPPARSPWLKNSALPRLYYSQVLWIDTIETNNKGQVLYRVNEKYGLGDIFWAAAEAFRPLTDEELEPIHPEAELKRVVVNVDYQTMSCFEGNEEVYFSLISSGGKWDAEGNVVDKWATPLGTHSIWRKLISIHMIGGTTGAGYDLPGIAWTMLFTGEGVAIHSTFWHNDFGVTRSHGCVNASPEDAKWVFRWTSPVVTYDPGDSYDPKKSVAGGSTVEVIGTS
ncbi:MAG TPA: L,D-transpeptidase [Anaerolineaceae bacterium]|nr:L,D-transpeptidase [Anaerolineaceae bacterium]